MNLLLGLKGRASSTKKVKLNIEPVVCFFVFLIILSAYFFARQLFLQRFCFRSSSVFIGATQKQSINALDATKLGKYISAQTTADDVSQMWYVIDIRQC